MKRLIYFIVFCFLVTKNTHAQNTIFLTQGRVEFEKKVNLYAQVDDEDDDTWKDLMKKMMPQFKTTYFDLEFNGNKTLFKPGRENTDNNKLWTQPAEDNTIYTNLSDSVSVAQKNVYEQTFLLHDSTRKIKWKITE